MLGDVNPEESFWNQCVFKQFVGFPSTSWENGIFLEANVNSYAFPPVPKVCSPRHEKSVRNAQSIFSVHVFCTWTWKTVGAWPRKVRNHDICWQALHRIYRFNWILVCLLELAFALREGLLGHSECGPLVWEESSGTRPGFLWHWSAPGGFDLACILSRQISLVQRHVDVQDLTPDKCTRWALY